MMAIFGGKNTIFYDAVASNSDLSFLSVQRNNSKELDV